MKTYRIAAIPGDGIGTEVVDAGVEVLKALAARDGNFSFQFDRFVLKMPVFGVLIQKVSIARFSRLFAQMLTSGVPILESIDVGREAAGNRALARAIGQARTRIEQGVSVSDAFAEAPDDQRVLVHKLILADGPFRGWLWDRLA